jgi:hypothetical protein
MEFCWLCPQMKRIRFTDADQVLFETSRFRSIDSGFRLISATGFAKVSDADVTEAQSPVKLSI